MCISSVVGSAFVAEKRLCCKAAYLQRRTAIELKAVGASKKSSKSAVFAPFDHFISFIAFFTKKTLVLQTLYCKVCV